MDTYWQIYPEDCNPLTIGGKLMVHGGTVLLKADRAAAVFVKKMILRDDAADLVGLTVGVENAQFFSAAKLGDTVRINCKILELGRTRMTVYVRIFLEEEKIFEADISFCSFARLDEGTEKERYTLAAHGKTLYKLETWKDITDD